MIWIWLAGSVLLPSVFSFVFLLLTEKTRFASWNYWLKQAVIGVVFGALTCLTMLFATPYEGYELSLAHAIPLCAGFLFGGPAGILAGVIGAAFRWFAVFPALTDLAQIPVTVTLLLSGIFAALSRKFLFDNKRISVMYSSLLAIFTTVLEMMMVFLVRLDDVQVSFTYVYTVSLVAAVATAVCVLLVSAVCLLMTRQKGTPAVTKKKPPIVRTFTVCLMICVVLSFAVSGLFTSFLQTSISQLEVKNLLSMNVADTVSDITTSVDRELASLTRTLTDRLDNNDLSSPETTMGGIRTAPKINMGTTQKLISFASANTLTFAGYVDTDGTIIACSASNLVGMAVTSYEELSAFSSLCKTEADPFSVDDTEIIVADRFITVHFDGIENVEPYDVVYRCAAATLSYRTGYLITAFNANRYVESLQTVVAESALHRHIGQEGYLFVLNAETGELVSSPDDTITPEDALTIYRQMDRTATEQVLSYTDADGVGYYYWLSEASDYLLVGCIPISEANFYRDISVYVLCFMLLLIFCLLFTVVFLLLKGLIVNNIHRINNSLTKITEGDLSEQVNIRGNREFDKLSDDINQTVGRLKELISEAEKRIDAELEIAKSIQLSVLPSIFPPYPSRTEFEIFARMDTAKEVGGDFYDFYLADENRLIFLIADVSGKGIPAAMFMMNAKSIIKDLVESGLSVSEAFTRANEKFCASNDAGMFVTAWMGSLDLRTGKVCFANAGHNPPVVRHGDGSFEYFKSRPGFVLAGMEGMKYREGEFTLEPGDEILLYTDGVTEATDKNNQLFGDDRLLGVLNATPYAHAEDVCTAIKQAIDEFVGEAPQFDDITIVSLKYLGNAGKE